MSVASELDRAGAAPTASGPESAHTQIQASTCRTLGGETPAEEEDDVEWPPKSMEESTEAPPMPTVIAIDGIDLLERVAEFLARFILHPTPEALVAHTLWVAHTHLMEAWQSTPRLAFLSPEPASGKSRAMEITGLLVPRALLMVNSSAAFLLRAIQDPAGRPTYLCDEVDTIFGDKGRGNEELRGLINSGYRKGAVTGKCGGSNGQFVPEMFETYAAMALAGLGSLPDTILTRSVIIRLKKKAPDEEVASYRLRLHEPLGHALRDELALWAESVVDGARELVPQEVPGVVDRNADVWEPLLAVAELAGGPWPARARDAAVKFIAATKKSVEPTLGVLLLADIHLCFGDQEQMSTAELIESLIALEESEWAEIRGRPLDPRTLAKLLRDFEIRSTGIRLPDGSTPKGYKRSMFHDAWKRYLPNPGGSATSATSATARAGGTAE